MKTNLDSVVSTIRSKSRKHRIGVDIDNTLFHIPVIEYVNRKYGTSYKDSDMTSWSLQNFPEAIRNDVLEQFRSPDFMCTLKPEWGTYGKLRDWHAAGNKIYAVSRRADSLFMQTGRQLEKEFPGLFEDYFFIRPNESKASCLKWLGCDVHVDDWDVEDSVNSGISTWLIVNEKTAYNESLRTNTGLNQALALQYVNLERPKWVG